MSTQYVSIAPPILGVDEAWDKMSPQELIGAGFHFVIGYLSPDRTGKNLTTDLVRSYLDAGLAVLPVWEWAPDAALGGYTVGVHDATMACNMLDAMQWPQDRSVYFAIDFDVRADQMPSVVQYMTAAREWCARRGYRADAYGGFAVIRELLGRGLITYGWQTYAWSGGQWVPGAVLHQTDNDTHVGFHVIDRDTAYVMDFGQWMPEGWTSPSNPGGPMDPQQSHELDDVNYAVTQCFSFEHPGTRVPLQTWTFEVNGAIRDIASALAALKTQGAGVGQAVQELVDVDAKLATGVAGILTAQGQQAQSEQLLVDCWQRIAAALERLSPPTSQPTSPASEQPAPHPADTLS